MILAKVVGTVVATRKDERLVSNKLLLVRPVDPGGKLDGAYLVAVDTVDAGAAETVLDRQRQFGAHGVRAEGLSRSTPPSSASSTPYGDGERE